MRASRLRRGWVLAWASALLLGTASSQLAVSSAAFSSRLDRGVDSWSSAVLQPPTGLGAAEDCSGGVAVDLSWAPSASGFATGYAVARDGVELALLGSAGTTTWTDTSPTAASHDYAVRTLADAWTSVAATVTGTVGCAPVVAVDTPPAHVSGSAPLSATAGSSAGITAVTLQHSPSGAATWTDVCTGTTDPYGCSWATTTVADGTYDLRAVATDGLGRTGTSSTVSTTVDNTAPAVAMTHPGSPVPQPATLSATVTDAGSGVASVTYQYAPTGSGSWSTACAATATPWSCTWDSSALVSTQYDLRAVAVDVVGNGRASASVTSVQAGAVPSSEFAGIGPAAGRTSNGSVTVQYPTGTEDRDLLLLVQANATDQSVSTPTGWSLVSDQVATAPERFRVTIWYRTAGAETSVPVTVRTDASGTTLWVVRYDRPAGAPVVTGGHTALRQGMEGAVASFTPSSDVTTTGSATAVALTVLRSPNPVTLPTPRDYALRATAAGTGPVAPTLAVADAWTATARTLASPTWSQTGTPAQWSWLMGAYR